MWHWVQLASCHTTYSLQLLALYIVSKSHHIPALHHLAQMQEYTNISHSIKTNTNREGHKLVHSCASHCCFNCCNSHQIIMSKMHLLPHCQSPVLWRSTADLDQDNYTSWMQIQLSAAPFASLPQTVKIVCGPSFQKICWIHCKCFQLQGQLTDRSDRLDSSAPIRKCPGLRKVRFIWITEQSCWKVKIKICLYLSQESA